MATSIQLKKGRISLKRDSEARCPRCRTAVVDLEKHITEIHNVDSDAYATKNVRLSSPPVTGAPLWKWEEEEEEVDDEQPMND
jgi:hypothetical protein